MKIVILQVRRFKGQPLFVPFGYPFWVLVVIKSVIYEVDPLACPKCLSKMRVISVIEDKEIIKKILKHLDLWDARPGRQKKLPFRRLGYSLIIQPALVRLSCILQAKLWSISNLTFCVYSVGDRSGPGILRSHPVKITATAIRITLLMLMPGVKPGLLAS